MLQAPYLVWLGLNFPGFVPHLHPMPGREIWWLSDLNETITFPHPMILNRVSNQRNSEVHSYSSLVYLSVCVANYCTVNCSKSLKPDSRCVSRLKKSMKFWYFLWEIRFIKSRWKHAREKSFLILTNWVDLSLIIRMSYYWIGKDYLSEINIP